MKIILSLVLCSAIATAGLAATGDVKVAQRSAAGSFPDVIFATANNGVWITSSSGVPAISQTLPTAVQDNLTRLGTVSSGTWNAGVIAGQYGGTGVANTGKTITLGGNLTTSGAFATTLTVTNTTTVTLPTTGTLATTAATVPSVAGTSGQVLVNGGTTAVAGSAVTLTLPTGLTGINSVTSTAGQPLVLATGTSGTAISIASATNGITFTNNGFEVGTMGISNAGTGGISLTTSGSNCDLSLNSNGSGRVKTNANVTIGGGIIFFTNGSSISQSASNTVTITNNSVASLVSTATTTTLSGSIQTSAPNTGTAGAWKLGIRVAATVAPDTTQYLQVDVGGTLYKVGIVQ